MSKKSTTRLRKYADSLQHLCATKSSYRTRILREKCKDDGFVKCICDCTRNILEGNIPLSTKQRKRLDQHKKLLRKLSADSAPIKRKRSLLVRQSGGAFIGALLRPIVSVLGSILGPLLGGRAA